MSDTTPIPPASERELLPCPHCGKKPMDHAIEAHTHALTFAGAKMPDHGGSHVIECVCGAGMIDETREAVLSRWNRRAALSHPSTPQGWKQIGWTCGDGDCGRIHESPGADGSYAVPVYVPAPHTKETSP